MAHNATIVSLLHEHLLNLGLGLDPVLLVGPLVRSETLGAPEVWQNMLNRASAAAGQGAFGLRVTQRLSVRHLGVLCYLMIACSSIQEALDRAARYQALVSSGNPLTCRLIEQEIELSWPALRCVAGQIWDELNVGCVARFTKLLTDGAVTPSRVDFVGELLDSIEFYDEMLGCEVRFRQPLVRMCLPADVLCKRIRGGDPVLLEILTEQAELKLQTVDPAEGDCASSAMRC